MFVKDSLVAELLQIELQRSQLHTALVWRIGKRDASEVRLPCLRTYRREFRADDLDDVITLGKLIGKRLQLYARRHFRHLTCSFGNHHRTSVNTVRVWNRR